MGSAFQSVATAEKGFSEWNQSTPAGCGVAPGVSETTAIDLPSGDQVGRSSSSGTGVVHEGCAAGAARSSRHSDAVLPIHWVKASTWLPGNGANTGRW